MPNAVIVDAVFSWGPAQSHNDSDPNAATEFMVSDEGPGTVTITPPGSYELTGTAKPRPGAPPELLNALKMLGPTTADGGHSLSLAGSF